MNQKPNRTIVSLRSIGAICFKSLTSSKKVPRRTNSRKPKIETLERRELFSAGTFFGVYNNGRISFDGGAPAITIGQPGDQIVMGDWNGNGRETPGIFRNGNWILDLTGNGEDPSDTRLSFGWATDKPVAGDWNRDGKDTVGVYRNGTWLYDRDGDGYTPGVDDASISFGWPTDKPVVGDWNGAGRDTPGVFRNGTWILDETGNGYDAGDRILAFGFPDAQPVPGDWNGNGKDTPGVLQSNGWVFDLEGDGYTGESTQKNIMGEGVPVAGNGVYSPMQGPGIEFIATSVSYNPTGSPDRHVAVNFRLNNPRRIEGDVSLRLYWASGPTLQAEYVQPAGEKIFTVSKPNWFGSKSLRFAKHEISQRPAQATHLISVINGDHAVPESNLHDNSVVTTLAPRTFIFRIGGGLSSAQSDLDGINVRSVAEGYAHPVISFPTVRVPWYGAVSGPVLLQNARRHIEVSLRQYHWRELDRVILIGHSYGGEAARRIAGDLMSSTSNREQAYSLILLDPINWDRVQIVDHYPHVDLDQSRNFESATIPVDRIRNVTGNPSPDATGRGYRIAGVKFGTQEQRLWYGKNNKLGGGDDLAHTTVDKDPAVHQYILDFIRQRMRN